MFVVEDVAEGTVIGQVPGDVSDLLQRVLKGETLGMGGWVGAVVNGDYFQNNPNKKKHLN